TASAGADETVGGEYPITVDNCGFSVSAEEPPERIVTIKSTSTELVLALGLGDRLVGTAFPDGPLPDGLAEPDPTPPVPSDQPPGSEAVLAVERDIVFSGWESNFTSEPADEREGVAARG